MEKKNYGRENKIHKAFRILFSKGPAEVARRIKHKIEMPNIYHKWFLEHRVTPEELERQRKFEYGYQPKVSILVPCYRTPEKMLREMIDSVIAQSYEKWELCLADASVGSKIDANGKQTEQTGIGEKESPIEHILAEYAAKDSRIRYKVLAENGGISKNTNEALAMAEGDIIALLDHDDILEPDALFEVVGCMQNPVTKICYTDEDKVTSDLSRYMDPNFKPDFSIDLFRSHNYITHFFAIEKVFVDRVGGFNPEFDGAQDYEFMFRCIEEVLCSEMMPRKKIPLSEVEYGDPRAQEVVGHVPKVLYHWRLAKGSTADKPENKLYAYEAGRKAIEAHLQRAGISAETELTGMWGMYHTTYAVAGLPLLSIIIPNKDHAEDLENCIRSIEERSAYKNIEYIIVENNSTEKKTFALYERLQKEHDNLRVVLWEKEFNYSAINNYATEFARGQFLLFLNNDTEMIGPNAISEMLGICVREDVGIVGAKLLYPDDTVQHAGIVLGFNGYAQHVFSGIGRNDYGFMVRARINMDYNAVTGACMMISKENFDRLGGFDEFFPVAGNDVDICLRIREKGKLVVYDAFSEWYHYE
ncbi:MAG: glycosyltransferase family 2 protein, partial [Lachnospiraceae bacterium]|nr:glycosyltransferase family 2 protein [Lachnospiraceae bacterium]